jgi:hypothetical protein
VVAGKIKFGKTRRLVREKPAVPDSDSSDSEPVVRHAETGDIVSKKHDPPCKIKDPVSRVGRLVLILSQEYGDLGPWEVCIRPERYGGRIDKKTGRSIVNGKVIPQSRFYYQWFELQKKAAASICRINRLHPDSVEKITEERNIAETLMRQARQARQDYQKDQGHPWESIQPTLHEMCMKAYEEETAEVSDNV